MRHADPARSALPDDDQRWQPVQTRMRQLGYRPDALIEVLHVTQQAFGYLDDAALRAIGQALGLPPSTVYGVATFYSYFSLRPRGEHTCVVCTGTACYINGAPGILHAVRDALGVEPGGTTPDGRLTLLTGRCFGSCSLAPAAIVDGQFQDHVAGAALVERLTAP